METVVDEVAAEVFRISTHLDPPDLVFNQYLVRAAEPLLFHTGHRNLFPAVRDAVARMLDPASLRWISFGHLEADERGAMNEWLEIAPHARVAHGQLAVRVSLYDQAVRPPLGLADYERLDLGGHAVRWIGTAHVPHGWDSGVLFEETTRTLLCGDLFTRTGRRGPTSDADPVGPALATDDLLGFTALTPATAPSIRALAGLNPSTLGLMHGPAFVGDGERALDELADGFRERLHSALAPCGGMSDRR